jgi:hypothetical protein
MLIVGAMSLVAMVVVVTTTALYVVGGRTRDARVKVLLAAIQAGVLTPLWLLLWSYVYSWAEFTRSVYVAIGVVAFAASGALLLKLPRNAASNLQL